MLKIGIARGIADADLVPAFEAALAGGFDHLEITLNTTGAYDLIALASKTFAGRAQIGAGTVTTAAEASRAVESGARFIVSPVADPGMTAFCRESGIPFFPGALTPSEIWAAWNAGAEMVKVFPVSAMGGASYIREVKGPFDRVKLLACGGVTPENLPDFVKAGADGIAIGASLFRREWIAAGDFAMITERAKAYGTC
jgi:2-dehydro-3-deoxyphosphogluconate aldolase/(4S)-4-hydroxy-2-oxoglutarate aldolase